MDSPRSRLEYVSTAALRRMFDEDKIEERAKAGELRISILSSHDASPSLGMPRGTKTQLVAYVDRDGSHVAEAHRYLLPSGKLGASGRPDPKALRRASVVYKPWWGSAIRDSIPPKT